VRPNHRFAGGTTAVLRFPRPTAGHPSGPAANPPRLLDRVRAALRTRHYSPRTEKAYVGWIRRFILFHGKRHPEEMAEPEIAAFLSSLADPGRVSASTQNQALASLLFLCQAVLGRPLAWMGDLIHAKRPARAPTVLTRAESRALVDNLTGPHRIVAGLLYGGGLRLLEALQLRIKDVDLERREILVRDGKGRKDRHTVLPEALIAPLREQISGVRAQHLADLAAGNGAVALPDALRRKYSRAPREWVWQWLFPATRSYLDAETGELRRHHLHETAVQRVVAAAARRRHQQTRYASHPPSFLRNSSARGWLRHSHHPGASGTQGREHDDDLHPRPQPRPPRRSEPARRLTVTGATTRLAALIALSSNAVGTTITAQ
jgi:integron integrase